MNFWKYRIADGILCAAITVSLVFTVCSGFILEDSLSGNPAVVITLSLLLQGILILFSYNRASVGIGVLVGAALAVFAIAYAYAFHPMADEATNSLFLYLVIQVITAVMVYLLGRTRIGIAVLFLLGILITAGAHFLQFPAPMWSSLILPAAAGMLFLYRMYLRSLSRAALGKIRNGRYLLQLAAVALAAFAIAVGLFFGIVRPLNPPTQELRLITTLQSMDLMARLGVSSVKNVLDPSLSSESDPDHTEYDDAQSEPPEEVPEDETPLGDLEMPEAPQTAQTESTAIRYDWSTTHLYWLLLLIPLAIAAAYVGRILYKRSWRKRVQQLSPSDAVLNYYRYFLSRLGRAGLKRAENSTLREFVSQEERQLEPYTVEDTTFAALTDVYERVIYGTGADVTEEERSRFDRFYERFLKNLRREYGVIRYYLLAFRF